jgi:acetyl-CoA/propionyl-CoA carboxylase biotin carboxyl carrier protein
VRDPAFTTEPFSVFTQWIETEFDNQIPAFATPGTAIADDAVRETIVVEVSGRRLEVSLPAGFGGTAPAPATRAARRSSGRRMGGPVDGNAVLAPMQGTIVRVAVSEGEIVAVGDLIVVVEAMKMEQPLSASRAGRITGLGAALGDVISAGATICTITEVKEAAPAAS